jgi:hypothetical protein
VASVPRFAQIAAQTQTRPGFADPENELSIEWLNAREKIIEAQKQHDSKESKMRVLLICGSPRTDQTCPSVAITTKKRQISSLLNY